ncbi:ribosomal protein S6 kinase delta-1 isoform X1 [Diorhabda sublineata]|uniref:ribosomal protein S6 kinase delta-1 isoform X1 n=1 Tax=Diorhabda sublineata TaxID=1163346 RepID=UPI0024E05C95|nr:ribosomal protein S6 kinase delta-1 isoform X1 [Diorhabda sublineata]
MVSVHDKWIRIFDIPDVRKHKNGFTIYKVVSMLYPENCPDAVTRVIVWKRFNDFRRLNRELKGLYKKLTTNKDFPNLPAKTVLKRFDDETIQERKQSILNFLEFIGANSQLFTCKEFAKFLETSYTPVEHLSSNINSIRAELKLPEDPEVSTTLSEDDITISDTDSVSTVYSLNYTSQIDTLTESTKLHLHHPKLQKFNSSTSINSHTSSNKSDLSNITNIFDNMSLLDGQGLPFIKNLDENVQYILDASVHINLASELEEDRKYQEAHIAYNTAIDILVKYGIDDTNYERRQLVKYKVDKYKIHAEKIYNMYLSPEIKDLQFTTEPEEEEHPIKRPLFDLYKYKVVKILNNTGILVLHSELQKLFYIKIIQKTSQFLEENLILPKHVPYMVRLDSHYNCENAVFLVLEYCSGVKLSDYLKRQVDDPMFKKTNEILTCQFQDESDNESELSFTELINDYNNSRMATSSQKRSNRDYFKDDKNRCSSDDSFEKIDMEGRPVEKTVSEQNLDIEQSSTSNDTIFTEQIFRQQKYTRRKNKDTDKTISSSRKQSTASSQRSQFSSFDMETFTDRILVPDYIVVKWTAQLLIALDKLHTLGVICRDLQMNNLLIDDNDNLVLTYMCNIKELRDLFSTNINYNLAPEVYSFHQVTNSADWFSFGAILYELLVGKPLSEIHLNGLSSCTCLRIPRYVSPEGRSILKQLLTYDPEDRLGSGINGTENIKSHPFFKSVSWNSLI